MINQPDVAKVQAVIVAQPGAIRGALQSILALFPRLEISGVADGGLTALKLVRQLKPALVVIDSGLSADEIAVLLEKIKQEQPQIYSLVFADTTRQQEAFLALGADAVVLHSAPTERLTEALDNMGLW